MNVEILALYIFSRNSRFLDIRENMYTLKITFIVAQRENDTQNANLNRSEIAYFVKSAKISTFTVEECRPLPRSAHSAPPRRAAYTHTVLRRDCSLCHWYHHYHTRRLREGKNDIEL